VADQATTNGFYGAAHAPRNGAERERRAKTRFPLRLPLNYRGLNDEASIGAGDTVDISSIGVRFTAEQQLPVGMRLEVTMRWPVALEGSIPLQLRLVGTILRTAGHQTALMIDQHEFRTARR
jgi:PilZ domain-containing protein